MYIVEDWNLAMAENIYNWHDNISGKLFVILLYVRLYINIFSEAMNPIGN